MATQARETSAKSQPIKPLLNKHVQVPNASTLVTIKKRNEKFRSFTIQVHLWKSMKEEHRTLNNIKKVLKNSKVLKFFQLDGSQHPYQPPISATQYVGPVIVRLVESLKNHLNLVKADFFFGENLEGIAKALNILARRLSQVALKMRCLSFGSMLTDDCEISNRGFRFYFDDGNMRRSGLNKNWLKGLRDLQDITLKYPWTSRPGANPLADWEKSLFEYKTLKSLSLEMFGGVEWQDEQLGNVGECLKKFDCLKKLRINFNWGFNQMTSNSFIKLFEGMSGMAVLECLRLDFPRCLKFTDYCLENLSESLAKMSRLRIFELNLETCQKINNEGIEFLSRGLQRGSQLSTFKLNLSRCPNIDTQGLRALGDTLKNLKLLQEVELVLECCRWIKIEDVENFALSFKETPISLKIKYQNSRNDEVICIKNSDLLEKREEKDLLGKFED